MAGCMPTDDSFSYYGSMPKGGYAKNPTWSQVLHQALLTSCIPFWAPPARMPERDDLTSILRDALK